MSEQEELHRIAAWIMQRNLNSNLRGVTAQLEGEMVRLGFYYGSDPTEDEREEVSCLATEVIAAFSDKGLYLEHLTIEQARPLPTRNDWVYRRGFE